MTALFPWRAPEDHPAAPFVRPGEIVYSRIRKPRIYHRDGSWWSIQPDPSGGEIRCRYPDGRAAMVALDPRNRERARSHRMLELTRAAARALERAEMVSQTYAFEAQVPAGVADHMTLYVAGDKATLLPIEPDTKDCG